MIIVWTIVLILIVILACIAVYISEHHDSPNTTAVASMTGLCCAFVMPLVVLQITKIEDQSQTASQLATGKWQQLQQEAIKYGYARYNPTNGVWEWIKSQQ